MQSPRPENMDINSILPIGKEGRVPYVPPLTDYGGHSAAWREAEFHCLDLPAERVTIAFWTGEPGMVTLHPWPYTEVCSILTGRVAIVDSGGRRREFGPGEGFVVPKGFAGEWVTIEPSSKIFLAIY